MKNLRKEMLQGKRPEACTKCYMLEDMGIQSHRQGANLRWSDRIPQLMEKTEADGHYEMKLLSADIRMGNQCNLRCRMCSPLNSKNLVADWQNLRKIGSRKSKEFLELDWFKQPEFWDLFAKYSQDLEVLHFAGGEPFLIKQHFAFLRNLVERGSSSRITLSYNTNMTVLPQELLGLWKHFKSVHVMVSIDGTEDVNHYIRFPSNWERIQKHISHLHSNIESLKIGSLDFNITVQIYNIFNLPELVDFLLKEYPLANYPVLSPLFGPEELSLKALPPEIKRELTEELSRYLDSRREQWFAASRRSHDLQSFIKSFEGLITFMNEKDHSHLLPRLKKRTEGFDRAHSQVGTKVIPQLARVFEATL